MAVRSDWTRIISTAAGRSAASAASRAVRASSSDSGSAYASPPASSARPASPGSVGPPGPPLIPRSCSSRLAAARRARILPASVSAPPPVTPRVSASARTAEMAPPGMVRRGLCQVRAARTKAGVALAPGGRSPRRASTRARSRAAHPASRSGLRTARRVPSSSRVPVSQGVRALADQARASGAQRWVRLSVSQPAAWEEGTQVAPSSSSPRSPAAAAISMMRAAASASRSSTSAVRARARALTPPVRRIVPPSRPHSSRRAATSRTASSAWKEASEATTSAPTVSRSPTSGAVRGSRVRRPPRRARATWRGRMKRVRPWASLLRSSQPRSMSGAAPGAVPPARRVPAGGPQVRA